MGRGRGRRARKGFSIGCKSGERQRALGVKGAFVGCETGIFMARGTHLVITEKTTTEKIRVVFYWEVKTAFFSGRREYVMRKGERPFSGMLMDLKK
jgi:hypothetical protein